MCLLLSMMDSTVQYMLIVSLDSFQTAKYGFFV